MSDQPKEGPIQEEANLTPIEKHFRCEIYLLHVIGSLLKSTPMTVCRTLLLRDDARNVESIRHCLELAETFFWTGRTPTWPIPTKPQPFLDLTKHCLHCHREVKPDENPAKSAMWFQHKWECGHQRTLTCQTCHYAGHKHVCPECGCKEVMT